MKEANEAESRRALTFMTDPLEEWISTWHVIKRELEAKSVARLDVTGLINRVRWKLSRGLNTRMILWLHM